MKRWNLFKNALLMDPAEMGLIKTKEGVDNLRQLARERAEQGNTFVPSYLKKKEINMVDVRKIYKEGGPPKAKMEIDLAEQGFDKIREEVEATPFDPNCVVKGMKISFKWQKRFRKFICSKIPSEWEHKAIYHFGLLENLSEYWIEKEKELYQHYAKINY